MIQLLVGSVGSLNGTIGQCSTSHSVGSIENNYKVLVYHGGGITEDNKIKYIKSNICGFQKEDT